ncbi:hypothetical protein SAMN05192534_101234 [Alteribacillus persepolensis]|uniref:Uncharacterized protein n=1 Tax=Alteribacillus persepolensis TaxID=568899 RepID=A0A1G7YQ32_9BACI|nr:hypothetical protein [Alteribacillus persepolensis]SDG98638.1 hypothetical protein SAMN05192534_101234 [Alteribacillus persepolensis]
MNGNTWKMNAVTASAGFLLFFALSVQVNLIMTAFIRALAAGSLLFILTYLFRWAFSVITMDSSAQMKETGQKSISIEEEVPENGKEGAGTKRKSEDGLQEEVQAASRYIKEKLNE